MMSLTNQTFDQCQHNPDKLNHSQPKILFIDDDPDIQTIFEMKLSDFDVTIEHAYFGKQGITDAISMQPDLIITDLAMPNGDGNLVLECLTNHPDTAEIPIFVVTGMRNRKIQQQALQAGAAVCLTKPLNFSQLLEQAGRYVRILPRSERSGK